MAYAYCQHGRNGVDVRKRVDSVFSNAQEIISLLNRIALIDLNRNVIVIRNAVHQVCLIELFVLVDLTLSYHC